MNVPVPNNLEAFWMPFTANRQFKKAPRLLASASGMYYTTVDGRKLLECRLHCPGLQPMGRRRTCQE